MEFLENFFETYFGKDEKIILACSTGPDSMFLLYKILKTAYKKNLVVCYFDHQIRKNTTEEILFLKNLCEKYELILEIGSVDIKKLQKKSISISLEELGRTKRYEFLEKIRKKYDSAYITTAHHLDDRIETFLFNTLRGSKLTGLINMTQVSGNILRPLLHIEKKEILSYLQSKKLTYMIDETNEDTAITRNFVRKNILPQFEKINSSYKKNLSNLIGYFEELKECIDSEVESFLDGKDFFSVYGFTMLSPFLQKEVIRYIFNMSHENSTIGLTSANIQEVIKFINGKNNKTKKEIKQMKLFKENNVIYFNK